MEPLKVYGVTGFLLVALTMTLAACRRTSFVRQNWWAFLALAVVLGGTSLASSFAWAVRYTTGVTGPLLYMLATILVMPVFAFLAGTVIVTSPDIEIGNGMIQIQEGSRIYKLFELVRVDTTKSYNLCGLSWKVGMWFMVALVLGVVFAFFAILAVIAIPLVCGRNPLRFFPEFTSAEEYDPELPWFCTKKVGGATVPLSPLLWGGLVAWAYMVATNTGWRDGFVAIAIGLGFVAVVISVCYGIARLIRAALVLLAQPSDSGLKAAVCPGIAFVAKEVVTEPSGEQ